MGISEEVFGEFNLREDIVLAEKSMSESEKVLVKSLLRSSILFQNLDCKDEEVLLKAMVSKDTEEHELIIREGEAGNVLYVVESGEYDCYKELDAENVYIKTYLQGEAFGELALMYNAPRAASIVTKKPGKLLLLDRCTFSRVLKVAALRKQEIIRGAIDKLELLRAIPPEQRYVPPHPDSSWPTS
jgi:cAMP-dependent protein kinase regulator